MKIEDAKDGQRVRFQAMAARIGRPAKFEEVTLYADADANPVAGSVHVRGRFATGIRTRYFAYGTEVELVEAPPAVDVWDDFGDTFGGLLDY